MRRLLAIAALGAALAGCGGDGGGASTPGAPASAPAAAVPVGPAPPVPEPTQDAVPGAAVAAPVPAVAPPAPASPAQAPAEPRAGPDEVTVWVTEGAGSVLLVAAVAPAGLTALQAVSRVAVVETRYGGRFVQAIEGREGSLDGRRDWFFMINGIEPDVGAAEVRLEAGDTLWWDLRSWEDAAGHPAAHVGAFPAPFSVGWDGARRPVVVRAPDGLADAREALEVAIGRTGEGAPHVFELAVDPGATGAVLSAAMGSSNGAPVTFRLAGSPEAVRAAALALAREPRLVARRYQARFDAAGRLVG